MNYLAVSASQKRASLSFFVNSNLVMTFEAERYLQPSQWFCPALSMFTQIYISFLDSLDFVAVDIGPGSFTGIKVGISFIKGLVQKNRIAVVPVNSLEANAVLGPENKKVAIIKNARRGLYFFGFYEKAKYIKEIISPSVLTKEKIINMINSFEDYVVYTDIDDFDNILKNIIKNMPSLSEGVGIIGLDRYLNGIFLDEQDIKPLYLREPDAVINFNLINK